MLCGLSIKNGFQKYLCWEFGYYFLNYSTRREMLLHKNKILLKASLNGHQILFSSTLPILCFFGTLLL